MTPRHNLCKLLIDNRKLKKQIKELQAALKENERQLKEIKRD